jgi:hypothetical protein
MPSIGEKVRGSKIDKPKSNQGDREYIWLTCVDCGKGRWTQKGKHPQRCRKCASKKSFEERPLLNGSNSPCWKGGRRKTRMGYILIWLNDNSPYYPMAQKPHTKYGGGYVLEHRLVMAQFLGRYLLETEFVHHQNGIKDDNRIENLELTNNRQHEISYQAAYAKGFQAAARIQNKELIKRIRLLELQVVELKNNKQLGYLKERCHDYKDNPIRK